MAIYSCTLAGAGAGAGAEIMDKVGAGNKQFRLRNTAIFSLCFFPFYGQNLGLLKIFFIKIQIFQMFCFLLKFRFFKCFVSKSVFWSRSQSEPGFIGRAGADIFTWSRSNIELIY